MASVTAIVSFVGSRAVCSATSLFTFTRPDGYRFQAGQFETITLNTREGQQTKSFTHCDAPGDPYAAVLTRMTGSAFKDALAALRPGDPVRMNGPHGKLMVPEGVRKAAFLVGGVGVTPAASIVRDAVLRHTGLECLVFCGNNDPTCMPLHEEFASYAKEPGIRLVDVLMTAEDSWTGERGFITADVVRRHCDPLDGWHWFVSGPPAMVSPMRAVLGELAVPDADASFEEFTGYQ